MTDKNQSIRTPLGRARGLGSAKDGVHHWYMQRLTAIALIPTSLYLITQLEVLTMYDYAVLLEWMGNTFNIVALLLFMISALYHAPLGIQIIIEDYVHHEGVKTLLLITNKLFYTFCMIATVFAIIKINFNY